MFTSPTSPVVVQQKQNTQNSLRTKQKQQKQTVFSESQNPSQATCQASEWNYFSNNPVVLEKDPLSD